MATVRDFEELIAWQRAIELGKLVYGKFRDHRDFSFRDQILRAVTSVSNNVAEGFDRGSNKEFRRFLRIAASSCNEVRSMVSLGHAIGYFSSEDLNHYRVECMKVNGTIVSLIKSMRKDYVMSTVPWLAPLLSMIGYL